MLGIEVEFTDFCNLRCEMCDHFLRNGKPHYKNPTFLKFENWKRILKNMKQIRREKNLSVSWLGESMLHPRFNELLKYAFEKNNHNVLFKHFILITNGTLMNKSKIENILYCASLKNQITDFKIHISIDAYKKSTYKKIKGKNLLEVVNTNVTNLIERRTKKRLDSPKIILSYVVMKENSYEVKPFYNKWKKIFKRYGISMGVEFDWPSKDGLYFRRLNSDNYKENDARHKWAAAVLGFEKTRDYRSP